ncbi:MAG: 4'-phosphopantetheinyl transferase [Myxococcota bacterium]
MSTDALVEGLMDPGVLVEAAALDFGLHDLLAEERPLVASAVETRQKEFATGRVLARRLLARMGRPAGPLLRDDDRVPRWPEGIVGSITHCEGLCLVAAASGRVQRGIGLDVEPDMPVREGVERVVCRGAEHDWVKQGADEEACSRRVKLVFSIKEATYKAFYPELRTFWSFQDVGVEVDLEAGRFLASLPEGPDVRSVEGRVLRRDGFILSSVCRG